MAQLWAGGDKGVTAVATVRHAGRAAWSQPRLLIWRRLGDGCDAGARIRLDAGLMKMMPDGHYDLKCWATDPERNNVIAYATFIATHTGPGGPPPTGKSTCSDYVYCMAFDGDKIRHND